MERDLNPPAASTTQCRGGCGFYGSPVTDGLCSKCFKEHIKRQQDPARLSPTSSSLVSTISTVVPTAKASTSSPAKEEEVVAAPLEVKEEAKADDAEAPKEEEKEEPKKKPTNRCHTCNKRVGLTGFECRCGGMFCSAHRYSDTHQCSFDYKKLGQQEIRKNNPVVVGNKIDKL